MALTKALVMRHAANRRDAYEAALLDVAQDHVLHLLALAGMFERPGVVFKGGTSLRKCRLGNAGRFSTDLDLAVPNDDDVVDICAAIHGVRIAGFTFHLDDGGDVSGSSTSFMTSSGTSRAWPAWSSRSDSLRCLRI